MARTLSAMIVLSTAMTIAMGQTFQYSRGWTNGKRAENPVGLLGGFPVPEYRGIDAAGQINDGQIEDIQTPCQLQKLRMLLQGKGNDQLYLLPCEVFTPRTTLVDFPAVGRFRHAQMVNNNNY